MAVGEEAIANRWTILGGLVVIIEEVKLVGLVGERLRRHFSESHVAPLKNKKFQNASTSTKETKGRLWVHVWRDLAADLQVDAQHWWQKL